MKTAIISDIHGNIHALENVLRDIRKQKCEDIVCLGDIVGYGYDPCACVDRIRSLNCSVLTGNHDAAVIGKLSLSWFNPVSGAGVLRDRGKLDDCRKDYLRNLRTQLVDDIPSQTKVAFTHGDLDGEYEFPYIESSFDAQLTMTRMKERDIGLLFVGHTHYAVGYYMNADPSKYYAEEVIANTKEKVFVNGSTPTIVNVGSVGYPRNQPYSFYAIYDDDESTVIWRRLKFDFKGYCKRMQAADVPVPSWMWRWVEEGYVSEADAFGSMKQ